MQKRFYSGLSLLPGDWSAEEPVRRNLSLLTASMIFSSIWLMISTEAPLTGFLSALHASDFVYGLIMSLPYFGALFQLPGSGILARLRRKTVLYRCAGIVRGLLWIAIGFTALLPAEKHPLAAVLLLASAAAVCGAFVTMTLTTLLGLVAPEHILGRYLSARNRVGVLADLGCGLLLSLLLDHIIAPYNYALVFGIAGLGSIADACIAGLVEEPAVAPPPRRAGGPALREMLHNRGFVRCVLFWVAWNFSYYIASPFNAKYCLGPLEMSFTQFTIGCNYLYYAVTIFALPRWGRFIDRFGCKNTIYFAFSAIGAIGMLWLFAKPGRLLIPVLFYGLGGTVWCVVELLNQHMMISQTPGEERHRYIAAYSVFSMVLGQGMATLCGGAVMGLIDRAIGGGRWRILWFELDKYQLLFTFACVLRFAVIFFLAPRLQEKEVPLRGTPGAIFRALRKALSRTKKER